MFAFDRETATIVAAVLCLVATLYIYNEFKKNRQDMEEFKTVSYTHLTLPTILRV